MDDHHSTEEVAGELVLCPILTTARAGEQLMIEWWAQEYLAPDRVRVWRVPPTLAPQGWYEPVTLITEAFLVESYACGAEITAFATLPTASELRFHGALSPGQRFGLTLRAGGIAEGFAVEAPVIVAVSVRRPPPCFRARAARAAA